MSRAVMTSHHVNIMMSKQPPFWIRHLGFQNFSKNIRKPPKITENTQNISKKVQKNLKEVKIVELKLIFLMETQKLQIWKNMSLKMTLPW